MADQRILESWYRHAARSTGFIGGALRVQRARAFLLQEQQRALIGVLGERYDALWLRLQAMPLPRTDQFAADLAQIGVEVQRATGVAVDLDLERLEELIRAGQ